MLTFYIIQRSSSELNRVSDVSEYSQKHLIAVYLYPIFRIVTVMGILEIINTMTVLILSC